MMAGCNSGVSQATTKAGGVADMRQRPDQRGHGAQPFAGVTHDIPSRRHLLARSRGEDDVVHVRRDEAHDPLEQGLVAEGQGGLGTAHTGG